MNFHSRDSFAKDGNSSEIGLREYGRRAAPSYYSSEETTSDAGQPGGAFFEAHRHELRQKWHRKLAKLQTIVDEFLVGSENSGGKLHRSKSMATQLMDSCESTLRAARAFPREEGGRNSVEVVGRLMLEVVEKWIQADRSGRTTKTTSALVIALQHNAPLLAVEVAHAVVKAGGRLSASTVLCTIAHAARGATGPEHIGGIYRFAQEALIRGLVPVSSSKTVRFYNVLLAAAGVPAPTVGRVGPSYRDVDSLDVAERLLSVAPLARSAIDANLPFSDRESEGRINLFLRALCSASLVLDVEQVRIWEDLTPREVSTLRREIGADRKLVAHISQDRRDADLSKPAQALVSQALLLAEAALEVMKNARHDRPLRYEIRGSTVNLLSNAAFFCESLSAKQAHALLSIISTALELPRVRRKMHSASIENAVLATLSVARDAEEGPSLLLRSCSTFVLAMRKGFTFSDGVMSRMRNAYDELFAAKSCDESVLADVNYLERRLAGASKEPRVRNRRIGNPSQTLRGGLSSPPSRFVSSFAELRDSMLQKNGKDELGK